MQTSTEISPTRGRLRAARTISKALLATDAEADMDALVRRATRVRAGAGSSREAAAASESVPGPAAEPGAHRDAAREPEDEHVVHAGSAQSQHAPLRALAPSEIGDRAVGHVQPATARADKGRACRAAADRDSGSGEARLAADRFQACPNVQAWRRSEGDRRDGDSHKRHGKEPTDQTAPRSEPILRSSTTRGAGTITESRCDVAASHYPGTGRGHPPIGARPSPERRGWRRHPPPVAVPHPPCGRLPMLTRRVCAYIDPRRISGRSHSLDEVR